MKARIVKDSDGYYVGEVYDNWYNWLSKTEWTGWGRVTSSCITKWGAKLELKKWKQKNCPEEFEI